MRAVHTKSGFVVVVALVLVTFILVAVGLVVARNAQEAESVRSQQMQVANQTQMGNLLVWVNNMAPTRLTKDFRTVLETDPALSQTNSYTFGQSPGEITSALSSSLSTLQSDLDTANCTLSLNNTQVRIYVTTTACSESLSNTSRLPSPQFIQGSANSASYKHIQRYQVPFTLRLRSSTHATITRWIRGYWSADVGSIFPGNYALVLNSTRGPDGAQNYLNNYLIEGRVHTNGILAVQGRPWFSEPVTSAGCSTPESNGSCSVATSARAIFKTSGSVLAANLAPNSSNPCYAYDCPMFSDGVDWYGPTVNLSNGLPSSSVYGSSKGNPSVLELGVFQNPLDTTQPAQHLRLCWDTTCTSANQYFIDNSGRMFENTGSWTQINSSPYFSTEVPSATKVRLTLGLYGSVGRVRLMNSATAAVGPNFVLEVYSSGDINIGSSLPYAQAPCTSAAQRTNATSVTPAICPNLSATNQLSLVSLSGNIVVINSNTDESLNAPADTSIMAFIFAPMGYFGVSGYDRGSAKGTLSVQGSIYVSQLGYFGTYSSGALSQGYTLRLTYDPRYLTTPLLRGNVLYTGLLSVSTTLGGLERE